VENQPLKSPLGIRKNDRSEPRFRSATLKKIVMRRLFFWEFSRTSWQYDIVVALILAFIFLTPRDFFKDQPRAVSVVQIPGAPHESVFLIDPSLMRDVALGMRGQRAIELVQKRTGKRMQLIRLESVTDPDEEVTCFMAFFKP
jgi:hypothetical protein